MRRVVASAFIGTASRAATVALALSLVVTPAFAQPPAWRDISGPMGAEALYELGDGTLFARDWNVLTRSFDGGATFENFPRPGGPILEFAVGGGVAVIAIQRDAVNYKQYFLSSDRGTTWTRIATEPDPVHVNLMIGPEDLPYAFYPVGGWFALERFVEGEWERPGVPVRVFSSTPPKTWTVSTIDSLSATYIGTTFDGIHSTRDLGQSWIRALTYRYVAAIAVSSEGRAALGAWPNGRTVGGVFLSDDHGLTWSVGGLTDRYMTRMEFTTAGDLLVLAARSSPLFPPLPVTTLYRLPAGGASWDSTGPFDFGYSTFHVTRSGTYILTAPGLGYVFSADGGATWTPDGVRGQDVYSILSLSDGSLLVGTLGRGIFRSADGGRHWNRETGSGGPDYFYTLHAVDTVTLAGTEQGLYASGDGGVSWSPVMSQGLSPDTGRLPIYALAVLPSGDLLAGTAAGVFRRTEGGVAWQPSGLASSTIRGLALAPDGVVYAATATEGLFVSADGGRNWLGRGLVRPDLQCVAVTEAGRIFAGVAGGAFISADAGLTWTSKTFTEGHVYSFLFNGNFNVFAATSSGVYASTDAGLSWASAGLEGEFVFALGYDQAHAMLAGIYRGGVRRTTGIITTAGSHEPELGIPSFAYLSQNYPNPFNPSTNISYGVAGRSRVTLRVYDMLGRVSETIVSGEIPPGEYAVSWNGKGKPSGVYFCSLSIEPAGVAGADGPVAASTRIVKMLLLR
jgi:hypothetical protein